MIGALVAGAICLVGNLLIWRRVARRGHYVVTMGGPNHGAQEWIPGSDSEDE